MSDRRLAIAAATTAGVAGAGLAWWSLWHEPRNVALRERSLRLAHWRTPLTVAVVADLHAGTPHVDAARLERIVARVNRARPDLVALLGDYSDPDVAFGHDTPPEVVAGILARLDAPLGRYAVLGNHDWDLHGARVPRAMRSQGITVLENDALPVDGEPFWIAGLADLTTRRPRIDATLSRVPDDAPVLLLSHNPDVFPHVPDRVALTIAGHTHGAQVDIPVLRDKLTPSRHGAEFTGHVVDGERQMWVSPGIGTSRLPIRLGARPEVTLLRLEPR